ncbi:hypothetical protein [Streptosporangium sp. NPDC000396]|uniref:hypothetical protein n=1 Tax=Streptosporangium sp. NPDC000396 TaxID=3366185 RepID=UPI0036AAD66E
MRLTAVLLVPLVLLVAAAACGGGGTAVSSPPVPALPTPPPVAFPDAAATAARDGKGGRVMRLHLYGPQPPGVWRAAVLGGDGVLTYLRMDATTGAVANRQAADPEDASRAQYLVAADEIGVTGAEKAATEAVPGAWIASAGLEEGGRGVVWKVEMVDQAKTIRKVEVSAATAATRIVP